MHSCGMVAWADVCGNGVKERYVICENINAAR